MTRAVLLWYSTSSGDKSSPSHTAPSFSGQDIALSRRRHEFDSRWGYLPPFPQYRNAIMGANSSRIKSLHLGMPHGTAQNRLRKNIVFSLLQRLNENVCFKCGQEIGTPEELSIEHKVPWLYADPDLFWDLSNIAFSHRDCNRPDRYVGKRPKAAPPGKAWCVGCKDFVDEALFHKNRTTWNGLQKQCRHCQAKRRRSP